MIGRVTGEPKKGGYVSSSTHGWVQAPDSRRTPDQTPVSALRTARCLGAITDEEAMASVQSGSTAAFEVLHDRYRARAYGIARSVCHDDGRAQEAVQDAFMSVWRTRMSYEDRRSVAPWLLTIVRNRAVDNARRDRTHACRRAGEEWLTRLIAPDCVADQVITQDVALQLVGGLAVLSDDQREAIELAFYDQLTHAEIATCLELPLGTVKGRIRLGMVRLRGEITHAIR